MKRTILSLALVLALPVSGMSFENIYLTANLDEHLPEFLAMEITKDFKDSVEEYNQHRKDPKYFLQFMKNEKLAAKYSAEIKNLVLPEIFLNKNTGKYVMKIKQDLFEFDAALVMTRQYSLNGKVIQLKKEEITVTRSHFHLLDLFLASATAEDELPSGFNEAYANLDSTKVFLAALTALDAGYKKRGMTDGVWLMGDVAVENGKKFVQKIDEYQKLCSEGLNTQTAMNNVIDNNLRDYNSLSTADQMYNLRKLNAAADPNYQSVLKVVKAIAQDSAETDKKRKDQLESILNADTKAKSCERMLSGVFKESTVKGFQAISQYANMDEKRKEAFNNHPCTKLTNLKLCLSQFTTQATAINDYIRRRGSDAKNAGVVPVTVPDNYPSETKSK